jgi:hypothetical protein
MAQVHINIKDFALLHQQDIPKKQIGKTGYNIIKSVRSLQNNKLFQPRIKLAKYNSFSNKRATKMIAIKKTSIKAKFPKKASWYPLPTPPKKKYTVSDDDNNPYHPITVSEEPSIEYDMGDTEEEMENLMDELLKDETDIELKETPIHPDLDILGQSSDKNIETAHLKVDQQTWMTTLAYREEQDRLAVEQSNWNTNLTPRDEPDHLHKKKYTWMTTDRVENVPDDYSGGMSSPDEAMNPDEDGSRGSSLTSQVPDEEQDEEKFSQSRFFTISHNPI